MMLRILHVVTHMNRGGLETMLMNYYRHIDRTKVQFDFLTHREYDGDFGEEIARLGGIIYHMPPLNPFSVKYRDTLNHFFDIHKEYQIIHVHQDCMSSVILKSAMKHGIKVRIAHSHSSSQDKNLKYLIKMYYRKQIPSYATDLIACSKAAGKWMFGDNKYEVLNNAIDAENYIFNREKHKLIRNDFGIGANEILVGHVGRFCYPKNHTFLLDIFHAIQKRIPAKLILVGDGELRSKIEEKVLKYSIEDRVIFTGVRSDVADLMQAMDIFIFPSNYEGLPVTLIEAQAAGLPCIISDKVPLECKITSLVYQEKLNKPADVWADMAIELSKTERKNTYEDVKKSGFDIKQNALYLQNYYLKKEDNICHS